MSRFRLQKVKTSTRTLTVHLHFPITDVTSPIEVPLSFDEKWHVRMLADCLSATATYLQVQPRYTELLCIEASVPRAYVSQLSPPMWLRNYIERQPVDPPPISKQLPSDVIAILIADSRDSVRPINASRLLSIATISTESESASLRIRTPFPSNNVCSSTCIISQTNSRTEGFSTRSLQGFCYMVLLVIY